MTHPQGPPHGEPAVWARAAGSAAAPEPPTRYIPRPGSQMDGLTPQFWRDSNGTSARVKAKRHRLGPGDPMSIVLIAAIVVGLIAAGLLGGELYARHRAESLLAGVAECVVQDTASVSFGPTPLLVQLITGHYTNISIETAGNQIRAAKGMKADVNIDDVRLQGNANSKGTIGALDATISWSSDGIKQTIQNAIPLFGSFVTSVKTNPSDGTIEMRGGLGSITAKPRVVNNAVSLQVVSRNGLGFTLHSETVQPALDALASELADIPPLGIHADSVQVTNDGVVGHFSTRNVSIPQRGELLLPCGHDR